MKIWIFGGLPHLAVQLTPRCQQTKVSHLGINTSRGPWCHYEDCAMEEEANAASNNRVRNDLQNQRSFGKVVNK